MRTGVHGGAGGEGSAPPGSQGARVYPSNPHHAPPYLTEPTHAY